MLRACGNKTGYMSDSQGCNQAARTSDYLEYAMEIRLPFVTHCKKYGYAANETSAYRLLAVPPRNFPGKVKSISTMFYRYSEVLQTI
jgi:hypothetical protein